jgi:hypothetical protein
MCPKPKPEYRQLPKDAWRSAGDQVTLTHKRNCLIRGLTAELTGTAPESYTEKIIQLT